MKNTRQRETIVEVLTSASRPLTRKEILDQGRALLPRLSPATVDRNIREMKKHFLLIGVQFPGQPLRYELPATKEHPHFICRYCENVYDLPIAMKLPKVQAPEGFQIEGGEIIYSGTCSSCNSNQENSLSS